MENPIKMDDLGVPPFSETSIWHDIYPDWTSPVCLTKQHLTIPFVAWGEAVGLLPLVSPAAMFFVDNHYPSPKLTFSNLKSMGFSKGCRIVFLPTTNFQVLHPWKLAARTQTSHPIEKEHHLPSTSIFWFHVNFQGCYVILVVREGRDLGDKKVSATSTTRKVTSIWHFAMKKGPQVL